MMGLGSSLYRDVKILRVLPYLGDRWLGRVQVQDADNPLAAIMSIEDKGVIGDVLIRMLRRKAVALFDFRTGRIQQSEPRGRRIILQEQ